MEPLPSSPVSGDNESLLREKEEPQNWLQVSLCSPLHWFRMLAKEMHWSFVYGIVAVNGISQGLGGAVCRVASDYYWKDVQKAQPSAAQVYQGITSLPWIVKPLWGLLTDILPVAGYRRRPYFILAGILGAISMLILWLQKEMCTALGLLLLTAGSAGVAIADVTIDACVAQNSINHPSLAADMQSLCGFSSSIGGLIGFSISGQLMHAVGSKVFPSYYLLPRNKFYHLLVKPSWIFVALANITSKFLSKSFIIDTLSSSFYHTTTTTYSYLNALLGVLGLLSIPAALVFSVGMVLKEQHVPNIAYRQIYQKLLQANRTMWATLKCSEVWRPCVYMFTSLALNLNIQEGMFYWYTDPESGPSFSQGTISFIFSIGSVGSLLGVLLYQNFLKDCPFRGLLFWSQLLSSFTGMLDLILVLRLNLKFGMPDHLFVVFDESVSQMIGRIRWMPLLVLSSKLCPCGIEGTFFALLMSIDHAGLLTSSWGGGLLLEVLKVSRTEFSNLWVAILIRSLLRVAPLALLYLVPKSNQHSMILPVDVFMKNEVPEALEAGGADVERDSLHENT